MLKWANVGSVNSFDAHPRRKNARSRGQRRRESAPTSDSPHRDRLSSPPRPASEVSSVSEYQAASRDGAFRNGLPGPSPFRTSERPASPSYPPLCENSPANPGTPVSIAEPLRWRHTAPTNGGSDPVPGRGRRSSIDDDSVRHLEPIVDYSDETTYSSYDPPTQRQGAPSPPESSQCVIDGTFSSFIAQSLSDPAEEAAFTYCSFYKKTTERPQTCSCANVLTPAIFRHEERQYVHRGL